MFSMFFSFIHSGVLSCLSSFWLAPNIRSWSVKMAKKSQKTCVSLTIVLLLCVSHLVWCTVLQKGRSNHPSSLDAHDITYRTYVFMLGCPLICHPKKISGLTQSSKTLYQSTRGVYLSRALWEIHPPNTFHFKGYLSGVLIGRGGDAHAVSGWVLGGCNTHPVHLWKE